MHIERKWCAGWLGKLPAELPCSNSDLKRCCGGIAGISGNGLVVLVQQLDRAERRGDGGHGREGLGGVLESVAALNLGELG